jgi:hypothetical protein
MAEVGGIKFLGGLEVMMVNDGGGGDGDGTHDGNDTHDGNERRREEIIIRQFE